MPRRLYGEIQCLRCRGLVYLYFDLPLLTPGNLICAMLWVVDYHSVLVKCLRNAITYYQLHM